MDFFIDDLEYFKIVSNNNTLKTSLSTLQTSAKNIYAPLVETHFTGKTSDSFYELTEIVNRNISNYIKMLDEFIELVTNSSQQLKEGILISQKALDYFDCTGTKSQDGKIKYNASEFQDSKNKALSAENKISDVESKLRKAINKSDFLSSKYKPSGLVTLKTNADLIADEYYDFQHEFDITGSILENLGSYIDNLYFDFYQRIVDYHNIMVNPINDNNFKTGTIFGQAVEFTAFINQFPGQDRGPITDIIMNAPEPYRSMILAQAKNLDIKDLNYNGTAHYSSSNNGLYLDIVKERTNPRGEYATLLHEMGHSMDWNFKKRWWIFDANDPLSSVESVHANALTAAINKDVENTLGRITDNILSNGTSGFNNVADEAIAKQNVINQIMSGIPAPTITSNSSPEDVLYDDVLNEMKLILGNPTLDPIFASKYPTLNPTTPEMVSVTDVYGGVTSNIMNPSGGYIHSNLAYWNDNSLRQEMYGNHMSASVMNRPLDNAIIEVYYPETNAIIEQMIKDDLEHIKIPKIE